MGHSTTAQNGDLIEESSNCSVFFKLCTVFPTATTEMFTFIFSGKKDKNLFKVSEWESVTLDKISFFSEEWHISRVVTISILPSASWRNTAQCPVLTNPTMSKLTIWPLVWTHLQTFHFHVSYYFKVLLDVWIKRMCGGNVWVSAASFAVLLCFKA